MSSLLQRGKVIAHQAGTGCQSCCFPRVAVLPSGRWLVSFRAASAKTDELSQRALVSWSDDEGRTWQPPLDPFLPQALDGRAGRFRTACFTPLGGERVLATLMWQDVSEPELPMFNPQTEGILDARIFTAVSDTGGRDWSPPVRLDDRPYDRIPLSITGPTLVMPDGRWACQFELNKTYRDAGPWHQAAVMTFSRDGGRTWGGAVDVARDPELRRMYWDQRPQVMPDGSVLSLFWTFDRARGDYVNIHAARSLDSGSTWSEPWDAGVAGQPAPPVPLGGGRIAMIYVDRTGAPSIRLRLSSDGGRTFPAQSERVLHEISGPSQSRQKRSGTSADAWIEMGAFSLGLPDAVALGGDELLCVYYSGADADHTDVEWVRVRV